VLLRQVSDRNELQCEKSSGPKTLERMESMKRKSMVMRAIALAAPCFFGGTVAAHGLSASSPGSTQPLTEHS
jgi:hypothetical protein